MVFKWAYNKRHGRYPEADAIDVMEYGTRGKRALELSSAIDRGKVAVLRDNDKAEPANWLKDASEFTSPGKREMFVGSIEGGATLEPQMVKANESCITCLASVIGSDTNDADSLVEYMTGHKTDWALRLLRDVDGTETLSAPRYIENAIDFIASNKNKA
ncbi:hypothetical protein ACUYFE_01230 [Olegusella massiliensis]|uniref:hypothetical protein n=1 Tax=Olegusella massiliensis TaxID=1776381 RepID=UPI00405547B1